MISYEEYVNTISTDDLKAVSERFKMQRSKEENPAVVGITLDEMMNSFLRYSYMDYLCNNEFPLVEDDSAVLHMPAVPFDFENPPIDPKLLYDILRHHIIKSGNALGIAAPQIGLPYAVFVIGNPAQEETMISVFNPKILHTGTKHAHMMEGCLSYPDLYLKVRRPTEIRVRYTTHANVTDAIRFDGITARIFQHEYDHINGVVFTDIVSRIHLEKGKKDRKIMRRRRK